MGASGASQGKRLRLEVLIASPPTRTCRGILAVMEEMTQRFPDLVRLDIYVQGGPPSVQPTKSYLAGCKYHEVPSAFVNGALVAEQVVPRPEVVEARIRDELAKGPDFWED